MKRMILLFCLLLTFVVSVSAQDGTPPVSMVSYEQRWVDTNGTIALKNNTANEISYVSFRITYLDMSNNPMDYAEFSKSVTIAPGMVKKLNIPAYERERSYHYYKTKNSLGNPTFKISYKYLEHRNSRTAQTSVDEPIVTETRTLQFGEEAEADTTPISLHNEQPDNELLVKAILHDHLYMWLFFSLTVALYIIVALMATSRNRNAIAWVLTSILITPAVSVVLLLFMGARVKRDFYNQEKSTNN